MLSERNSSSTRSLFKLKAKRNSWPLLHGPSDHLRQNRVRMLTAAEARAGGARMEGTELLDPGLCTGKESPVAHRRLVPLY